ncbi:MAG TPA: MFS transporter [Chloroflexaceae bacterium]|nr:MFS transporter [Chloroflexaceae bacterium]
METRPAGRLYYGWVVVAVTVATLLISAGIRAAPGVLIVPLELDMGWSRTLIATAVSVGLLLFGFAGPLAGWLVDRMGPRAVMLAGLGLMAFSMVASALMQTAWQMMLFWGAVSGLATGLVGAVMGTAVANRWFYARRGLVLGIFGAATSAGQLIFLPAIVWVVAQIGWRGASYILAAIAAALLPLVFLAMRDRPADVGQLPYGLTQPPPPAPRPDALGVMALALRAPAFWLLAATFFICGATSNGLVGTHLVPHAVDHGMTQATAAGALALMGMMNFVGTLGSGWLTDRYDPRKLLAVYCGFRGISLLFLPFVTSPVGLALFAILFGLDYIATVPPTSALVADTFGRQNAGTVFGWVFCAHQIGAALAAWLGGVARDFTGDYGLAFLAAGVLAITATVLSLGINRAPAPTPAAAD